MAGEALDWWPVNNPFSPLTTEVDSQAYSKTEFPGIDLRREQQEELLERLSHYEQVPYRRYPDGQSHMFSQADAHILSSFLREFRPKRMIEVGSGDSTGVTLDTVDAASLDLKLTIIDPSMFRVKKNWDFSSVEFNSHETLVQNIDASVLTDLEAGDLLFIDSSHVAKTGSDVLYLYLDIIPQLKSGVFIHAHDIFWPFEYPELWVTEGRSWNEIYLLRALLIGKVFEIVLWPSFLSGRTDLMPLEYSGSIYLRKLP